MDAQSEAHEDDSKVSHFRVFNSFSALDYMGSLVSEVVVADIWPADIKIISGTAQLPPVYGNLLPNTTHISKQQPMPNGYQQWILYLLSRNGGRQKHMHKHKYFSRYMIIILISFFLFSILYFGKTKHTAKKIAKKKYSFFTHFKC